MKKFALIGAVATLTLTVAACGGGGSDALSEREYIRALEDVCSTADGDLKDIPDPEGYSDIADASDDAISIIADAVDELNDIKPPDDFKGDHEDFIASLEDLSAGFEDLRDAADDEDDDAIVDAGETLQDASDDVSSVAESIGADDCVDVGNDSGSSETPTTDAPDEPTTETPTTDEVPETDEVPAITVPPVAMTMPVETEPPVVTGSGIATIDFNELSLPEGYTFANVDSAELVDIQNVYAEQFAGQIQAIGGAIVTDDVTAETFAAYVFFWTDTLDDATISAFLSGLTSGDGVSSTADVTTPGGIAATSIVYDDQTEALIVLGGTASVVVFGDAGSQTSMGTLIDALIAA